MSRRPIGVCCPTCLGERKTQSGIPCAPCAASGWIVKPLDQLTPEQAANVRRSLAEIPLDSDTAYQTESVRENLTKLLTGLRIDSISFPGADNTRLTLNATRLSMTLFPEYQAGKFIGLNVQPEIDPPPATPIGD